MLCIYESSKFSHRKCTLHRCIFLLKIKFRLFLLKNPFLIHLYNPFKNSVQRLLKEVSSHGIIFKLSLSFRRLPVSGVGVILRRSAPIQLSACIHCQTLSSFGVAWDYQSDDLIFLFPIYHLTFRTPLLYLLEVHISNVRIALMIFIF